MAVSGSKDFTLTRNEIIDGAIRLLGNDSGGKLGISSQRTEAAEALNLIVKGLQTEGIGIWMNVEVAVFFTDDTEYYSLGSSGDHATSSWVKTELSADASSGDATFTVDSITGMSDGDYLGIELDDDTVQWTTINGTPSSLTITPTAALSGDASENNHVYTYTTKITRPVEIIEARIHDNDDNEVTLSPISRSEYMGIPDKDSPGTPSQYYYDTQLDAGRLYVWPVADNMKEYIKLTARVAIDDFDAAANNAQMPVETLRALKWLLAAEIALEYDGIDLQKVHLLRARARELKQEIFLADKEYTSVFFM